MRPYSSMLSIASGLAILVSLSTPGYVFGQATGTASASTTPAAAAPATPEISAETTTKSAPFPGDWTWMNSNGRVVDSPMSTKYFTPEFRADINYTWDHNHPSDDSLGGSTETFRSDEFQLEQLSFGGDIRIDNVRGRFLTMFGDVGHYHAAQRRQL